ncbi:GNAT family N-acetyltransferase [Phaeovulum vinaykumarii]|uniref:N-acetylglutamate synthase, GNAT family n=1 Tax=Phaeovulum vinaykumarii TaxID=407234 RepID=A0A1N7K4S7_9RHOB|nr:GNAT family N-acetyltransferase [Phaeovulum vinaykumarii]SIS56551.1 N-acetylglutamate synthase, GNAT family [Phaeovulum vinaykumarii]SOB92922.1 N-acetylglutamate synthase-like GNAT family acetyltransferase [Phaeovulum vinaykumarii]
MIDVRTMTLSDLEMVLDWAADEGWNPGREDARAFLAADPEGFFIALKGGAPVAAISVVNHCDLYAFLGLYLCRPDWRGKGIGLHLWKLALKHAEARSVGLDAVPAQTANYARSGFLAAGTNQRWTGTLEGRDNPAVRDVTPEDVPQLILRDAQAGGFARPGLMRAWLAPTDTRRSVVLGPVDKPLGFATIRLAREGAKIGPVVAPGAEPALRLIRAAAARFPGERIILDVPTSNAALSNALAGAGFEAGFETTRMFRGQPPMSTLMAQALGTLELG